MKLNDASAGALTTIMLLAAAAQGGQEQLPRDTNADKCVIDTAARAADKIFSDRKKADPSGFNRTHVIEGADLDAIKKACTGKYGALGHYAQMEKITLQLTPVPKAPR